MRRGLLCRDPPVRSQQGKNLNTGAASVGGLVISKQRTLFWGMLRLWQRRIREARFNCPTIDIRRPLNCSS
jgi:hypothetical protein